MDNSITTIRLTKRNLHRLVLIKGNESINTYDEVITLLLKEYFKNHKIKILQ